MDTGKYTYFKDAGRVLLYLGIAVGIFFTAAIVILGLRGHRADVYPMPNVLHRYYVDVHNELTRIGLRVNLVKKSYPDITPGVVLYQSVPAGKKVGRLEKVTIYINHADPLIKMPGLVGNTIETARATLSQITFQNITYALEIAQVAEIYDPEKPPGTILAQFPLSEEAVTVQQKVYLLVSTREESKSAAFEGQNISILNEYLRMRTLPYVIQEIKPPTTQGQNGVVYRAEKKEQTVYLGIYYREPSIQTEVGLNLLEFQGSPGACKIFRETEGQKAEEYAVQLAEAAPVRYIALRRGNATYMAECDNKSVFQKSITVHDFS